MHSLLVILLLITAPYTLAQLTATFYAKSCPNFALVVRAAVFKAVVNEPRMAASLLRLHFHDCFVNGCDASLLLDDTSTFTGEKTAPQNTKSLRGFEVIDDIKSQLEQLCKGVVSCADIVTSAAQEAVAIVGGPKWNGVFGRRDSTTASLSTATSDLPLFNDNAAELITRFKSKGLTTKDLVALSGAHTIGQARCVVFRDRVYNFSATGKADEKLQLHYRTELTQQCPSSTHDHSVSPMDPTTPDGFDNVYFKLLQVNRGLFNSDQVLYSTPGETQDAVNAYSKSKSTFFQDFANAMMKMSSFSPLTGTKGEIRTNCRAVNQGSSGGRKSKH